MAIREKALGPDHPAVAQSLKNYAGLLSRTNRVEEAARMDSRARAILAKHSRESEQ
jgi:hypothetical protein